MKLYNFKIFLYASGFFCIFASIFIYGLIWLNNGFKLEGELQQFRKIIHEDLEEDIDNRLLLLNKQIMPSCFRGRK